ncbi:MAG: metallophosphatase family protein [Actinomycetota bacterium]|nr:metallophosphatase family protein [Actinomycetota bacterium]
MRVAALADVHGNVSALEAVLAEVDVEGVDLIVFLGDVSWGSFPAETLALVRPLADRSVFVQGNADRDLVRYFDRLERGDDTLSARVRWMVENHSRADRDLLATFAETAVLDVDGLGSVRFCHGSPRSLEECVTEATPADRMAELLRGVEEDLLVTAHTHVQYDRRVLGKRTVNPGSVGLPYEGRPGAYWALLGPDVELRRTDYDVNSEAGRMRSGDEPGVDEIVELLLSPPSREEAIEHAETVRFSG